MGDTKLPNPGNNAPKRKNTKKSEFNFVSFGRSRITPQARRMDISKVTIENHENKGK